MKRDVLAVWLAARDPRTPVMAKVLALLVAGYAVSPIDLIPDFIPVLGYLDDLIILPLGIALVARLVPVTLMAELRRTGSAVKLRPVSRLAAALIISTWIAAGAIAIFAVGG